MCAINYPGSLDTFSNPTGSDLLENATAALDHDVQHSNANDAIEALEAKVGANSSAVTTSHDYKLSGVTGSDKAVSKTGTETLTNKTLTAPQINMGSDSTGDLIYRNGSGVTSRLAIGTTDQILAVQAGVPAWIANPSASDASYSAKGIVKFDTDAATSGITVTSGVATLNTGTTANKIVKLNSSAQLPAVDGSLLTGVVPSTLGKINVTTTDGTVTGTGTETDFYTVSIAGNTLGTNNAIVGKCFFNWTNASTTSKVLKLIYGSTTIATVTIPSGGTTGISFSGYIDFMLVGAGSTSSQEGSITINGFESSLDLVSTTGRQFIGAAKGTASENSTGALNLKLSWTQNSGETFTMAHAVLSKII